jgi:predicted CXXCH cytochrome family protein
MKRIAFCGALLVMWVGLSVLGVTQVAADENPHGQYSALTSTCAACHRAHTSAGTPLLVSADEVTLCLTCHDGTGSTYNSASGEIRVDGKTKPSAAGPLQLTSAGGPATSAHMLGAPYDIPGGPKAKVPLTCGDCHDPHGNSNYRLLRSRLQWNGLNAAINFTATLVQRGTPQETVIYGGGSVQLCAACHVDYAQHAGGQFSGGTRHSVNVKVDDKHFSADLPLENGQVVCLTCHYAHGTRVTNTPGSGLDQMSTALKRRGDWGMCSQCHFDRP